MFFVLFFSFCIQNFMSVILQIIQHWLRIVSDAFMVVYSVTSKQECDKVLLLGAIFASTPLWHLDKAIIVQLP